MTDSERHAYNRAIRDAAAMANLYGQDVPMSRIYAERIEEYILKLLRYGEVEK